MTDVEIRDLLKRIAALESECAALRAENERLKKLETGEQMEVRQMEAATVIPTDAPVHNRSPEERKIMLFRTLFRGREDVYAVRWNNKFLEDQSILRQALSIGREKPSMCWHPSGMQEMSAG
ncbi:MAG TPA: hypothetical protein VG796_27535 [Verrucomicrobiales bacterium]|nr:hypothetical protein [Verrucomicrobiales bacterium]